MQSEKQRTERTMQQAKFMKLVATLIAFAVLAVAVAGVVMLVKKNPQILPHH